MKKTTVFILAFIIIASGVLFFVNRINKKNETVMVSSDDVEAYLLRYGWETDRSQIKSEEIIIPYSFNEVYSAYNDIQRMQGFDLSRYKGESAVHYTCPVTNYETQKNVYADIIVMDTKLIGANLKCLGDDTSVKPLNKH